MKRGAALLAGLTVIGTYAATAQVFYSGGTYSENFNGIFNSDGTGSVMSGVGAVGVQDSIPTLTTWRAGRVGGTGTGTFALFADWGGSGASATGRLYSYGFPSQTERALGSLASGTTVAGFGTYFINQSVDTYQSISISFDREVWRTQSTTSDQKLSFAYGLASGGVGTANFLTSASMIAYAQLDAVAPGTLGPSNVGVDGNASPNSAPVSATITGLNWAPGDTLFIRWQDANDTGNDAGLAIDNLSMVAVVPEPASALWVGLGLAGFGLWRRRSH